MKNFDLIPGIQKLETLFIMESPYLEEIAAGVPCSGGTGRRMATEIFGSSEAFGTLLAQKEDYVLKYGIMNSFPFALGLRNSLTKDLQVYTQIKNLKWNNRQDFYSQHINLLSTWYDLEKHTEFKNRLTHYINQASDIKHLVLCGYIAQSMYLHSFKQNVLPHNKSTPLNTKSGKTIHALFVNHPSKKNAVWDFRLSSLLN